MQEALFHQDPAGGIPAAEVAACGNCSFSSASRGRVPGSRGQGAAGRGAGPQAAQVQAGDPNADPGGSQQAAGVSALPNQRTPDAGEGKGEYAGEREKKPSGTRSHRTREGHYLVS